MSTDYPSISIITPSFNQGQYIEATIQSIIDQGYSNLEFIVVDGGSTDNTVEILKAYDEHITWWVSEPDEGQSHAINKGWSRASGQIINWINSDDQLAPGSLKRIAECFGDPSVNVVCGYADMQYPEEKIKIRSPMPDPPLARFLALGHFVQPSTFWRKSSFDHLMPLEPSLHYMMDYHLWLKYLSANGTEGLAYIDDVLANILMHEDAKSVALIQRFRSDQTRIVYSFLAAHGFETPLANDDKLSGYDEGQWDHEVLSRVEFELIYDQLFARDQMGNRDRLNVPVLGVLVRRYPSRLLARLSKKVLSRIA